MPNTITENRKQQGFVAVVALLILVVLTIIGIAVTQTSSTDIKIASNVIPYKQDFYVAEGGQHRERAELGRGNYAPTDLDSYPVTVATHTDTGLPGPAHDVNGTPYDFTIQYEGHFIPPPPHSATQFVRYDYGVDVTGGNVQVVSRCYTLGSVE